MLLFLEPLPLREDVVIELEHRAGLGKVHAVAVAALTDMIHHDGIDALGLQIRPHGREQHDERVAVVQVVEHARPAEREQAAVGVLERDRGVKRRDAEGHELILLVNHEADKVRVYERDELVGIALNLLVRELHDTVERRIGRVDQLKDLADKRAVLALVVHGGHVQVLALEDELRELVQALGLRAARFGHGDAVLDPVNILAVAESGEVLEIIRRVVVGEKQASAVKALDEHTLAVHVREAERAVHLVAALFARPALDRAEQRRRNLGIIHEVHLAEAHAVRAELVIGLVAEDRADAADDLSVAPGQPAARLAIIKRGVFARRPVREVIAVERGNVVRIIGIEPIGILHKLAQLVLGRDLGHDDRAVLFKLLHENMLLTATMTSGIWSGDSIARISPDFNLCVRGYSPNRYGSTQKIPRSDAPGDHFSCFCLQELGIPFVDRVNDRGSLALLADLQNVGCEAEAPVDECICVHAALPLS